MATAKQAKRQRKKERRMSGMIDGIPLEQVQSYLDSQYVCDHCGRLQPIHDGGYSTVTGEVFVAPCHEWNGRHWVPSGCPGEIALGAWNFERHSPADGC